MLEEADRDSVVDELYVWYVTDRTRSKLGSLGWLHTLATSAKPGPISTSADSGSKVQLT